MVDPWVLDAVLVPVGVALLVVYYVSLYFRVKYWPLSTVVGVNHMNRRAWVRSIMKDIDKKNILAVQTLRNSMMASTLLASTAILLCAGIAAFVASSTTNTTVSSSLNTVVIGSQVPALITVKFFTVLLCFVFSFMCHVQSIRYTNHAGYLISIPQGPEVPGLTFEYVCRVLERGSNFFTIGTRGFYSAFPFLLWLFGPIPMLVGCVILPPVLYHLDTASGFDVTVVQGPCSTEDRSCCPVEAGGHSIGTKEERPADLEQGHQKASETSPCLTSEKPSVADDAPEPKSRVDHVDID